jgi:hypothetical protein
MTPCIHWVVKKYYRHASKSSFGDTGTPAVGAALSELDARIVTEGASFAVIEANSTGELLFREHIAGAWLASPVRGYLDLLRSEGAKEMAEHLLASVRAS